MRIFRLFGYQVTATHLSTGKDFFSTEPPACDYIISNPPYSLKGEVLERLFDLGKPFAMLVGVVGLFESQRRFEMFRAHDFEIMYFNSLIKSIVSNILSDYKVDIFPSTVSEAI